MDPIDRLNFASQALEEAGDQYASLEQAALDVQWILTTRDPSVFVGSPRHVIYEACLDDLMDVTVEGRFFKMGDRVILTPRPSCQGEIEDLLTACALVLGEDLLPALGYVVWDKR